MRGLHLILGGRKFGILVYDEVRPMHLGHHGLNCGNNFFATKGKVVHVLPSLDPLVVRVLYIGYPFWNGVQTECWLLYLHFVFDLHGALNLFKEVTQKL